MRGAPSWQTPASSTGLAKSYNPPVTKPPIRYTRTEDGFRVPFATIGEGFPLVLTPWPFGGGLPNGVPSFDVLNEELGRRFRTVLYDGRGHGLGQRGIQSHTLADRARDFEAVVEALDLKRMLIFGTEPNVRKATLVGHVEQRVLPTSTVYTDELKSYAGMAKRGYAHARVNHSERVDVSGHVHTNTMEGFWSLLKRGLDEVYHSLSRPCIFQSCLYEYASRYNHRDAARPMFAELLDRAARSLSAWASGSPPCEWLLRSPPSWGSAFRSPSASSVSIRRPA